MGQRKYMTPIERHVSLPHVASTNTLQANGRTSTFPRMGALSLSQLKRLMPANFSSAQLNIHTLGLPYYLAQHSYGSNGYLSR